MPEVSLPLFDLAVVFFFFLLLLSNDVSASVSETLVELLSLSNLLLIDLISFDILFNVCVFLNFKLITMNNF